MDEDPGKKDCRGEAARLRKLEATLHKRVIGQEDAVSAVAKAVRRGRVGLKRSEAPDRFFPVLRPDRCRKNRDLKGTCGGSVWQRTVYDPC